MVKPVIRWAGGKRRMVPALLKYVPETFGAYHEPFAGGAALFFALQPKAAFLSDVNGYLVTMYNQIAIDCETVMATANQWPNTAEQYYKVRSLHVAHLAPREIAARFLYLNRLCVNGLFRENLSGGFNVPYDHTAATRTVVNSIDLLAAADALKGVAIRAQSFEDSLLGVKTGDFVFMDPPYIPFTKSGFTAYNKGGFGMDKHEVLASRFRDLDAMGVNLLLTNSDTPEVRELYKGFNIEVVQTKATTSRVSGQGSYNELIVSNSST